jgi:very-short-patch-repair endonuclease/predicted transcriptional regulator of viral defense system
MAQRARQPGDSEGHRKPEGHGEPGSDHEPESDLAANPSQIARVPLPRADPGAPPRDLAAKPFEIARVSLPRGRGDTAIAALADRQHGVVTYQQLTELGLGPGAIMTRIGNRRLHTLHKGVYAVGHRTLTPAGHKLAAVLACGPTAVLSHKSAGALWELLTTDQTRTDVTVPGTSRAGPRGVRVHRARRLHPEDVQIVDGIPVTSVARTVFDLAGGFTEPQLLRVIEQADRSGKLDCRALERLMERNPRRSGSKLLRSILADYAGAPLTRSELERRFQDLVRQARLPPPGLNVEIAGFTVDVCWPQWRLVVELDSRGYHSDPGAFERDRVRDATLQRGRYRILRVTDKRMKLAPAEVLADLRALITLAEEDIGQV